MVFVAPGLNHHPSLSLRTGMHGEPLKPGLMALLQGTTSTSANGSSTSSTVYTLRLVTSWDRASALSDPMAGVHVCLIGKSGSAVLHRVMPINDPKDHLQMMEDVCSSVSLCSDASSAQPGLNNLCPHVCMYACILVVCPAIMQWCMHTRRHGKTTGLCSRSLADASRSLWVVDTVLDEVVGNLWGAYCAYSGGR